ncbi:glycosyltransferase [Sphingomonas sp. Leaf25]|uniref:glycosyltransferase n=1 Tax=Sphingomonas sp. Leaf25 TaxID=1735692 RepID=UPI0006F856D7|nr:glycosyltransferase [Sphingomonas sp. Leaf25]KQN04301.1 hypothetical protein ASE78_17175 [Sphingomonas sp. Leaf25]
MTAAEQKIEAKTERPIVLLTSRLTTGGATLNAQMLAQQFRQRGITAELWCLYRFAELEEQDIPVRVMFDSIPRTPIDLLRMAKRFAAEVARRRPVAMFGFHPLANTLGSIVARGRFPFIGTQRNPAESQSRILGMADRMLGSTNLYSANIAVSNAVWESYSRHGSRYLDRLRVIHNGLPPLPVTDEDKRTCREALGLPVSDYLVGNVGRLHPQKSPDFLLDVATLVPEATFVLAGDGPEDARLRNEIARRGLNVILPGRVEGVNITRTLRALDLFLFPSRFEGFGRALIEALSQGLPVIAHDLPVTREVMGDGGDFLPLDALAWASRIRHHMTHPFGADRRMMAVDRANSFSLEAMVDGYLGVLLRK